MDSKLCSNNIDIYLDGIFEKKYKIDNDNEGISDIEFSLLMKSFNWYFKGPVFIDLYIICFICFPVLKYLIEFIKSDNDQKEDVEKIISIVDNYINKFQFDKNINEDVSSILSVTSISKNSPPWLKTNLLKIAYDKDNEVKNNKDINNFYEIIIKQYYSEELKNILEISSDKKLELLENKFRSLSTCKQGIFNILKVAGEKLISNIEKNIDDLSYYDQGFFYHSLSYFPQNNEIIDFYNKMLLKSKSQNEKNQINEYLKIIQSN